MEVAGGAVLPRRQNRAAMPVFRKGQNQSKGGTDQPVFLSASMPSLIADSLADRRFIMRLLAITECIALAMSVAGVYGVTSYTTSRRTQDIAFAWPLGLLLATSKFCISPGFSTTAIGLVIGLGAPLVLMRARRGMLMGLGSKPLGGMLIAVGSWSH